MIPADPRGISVRSNGSGADRRADGPGSRRTVGYEAVMPGEPPPQWSRTAAAADGALDAAIHAPATNGLGAEPKSRSTVGQHAAPRTILTRTWLYLAAFVTVVTLVGGAAGYAGAALLPAQYAARAELHYNLAQAKPNELLREDRTLNTQLVVLRSHALLEPVATTNGLTFEELQGRLTAMVVESSEVIQVEIHDASRERGLLLVQGIMDRYLALVNRAGQNPARDYVESQLQEVREALGRPGLPSQQAEILALREAALLGELDTIEVGEHTPAQVLTDPYSVSEPISPRPGLAAATGALTALLLAAIAGVLLARRWVERTSAAAPEPLAAGAPLPRDVGLLGEWSLRRRSQVR